MPAKILNLEFDEWNQREAARHLVTAVEIVQVFEGVPVFLANRRGHAATVMMIGPTDGGRLLRAPLVLVDPDAGIWRPATA